MTLASYLEPSVRKSAGLRGSGRRVEVGQGPVGPVARVEIVEGAMDPIRRMEMREASVTPVRRVKASVLSVNLNCLLATRRKALDEIYLRLWYGK